MNRESAKQPRHWLVRLLEPKVAIPLTLVALLLSAPFLIRGYHLAGVRDPGAPFDVQEFVAYAVPDDQNAFVEYRQAAAMFVRWSGDVKSLETALEHGWKAASDDVRQWIASNRAALVAWKQGTVKDKALFINLQTADWNLPLDATQQLRAIARCVKIETSRLEAEGKFDEAWHWHRALYRASRHCGQYGTIIERLVGIAVHSYSTEGIARWSGEAELKTEQLTRAIAQLQSDFRLTAPSSNMLKTAYVLQMNTIQSLDSSEIAAQLGVHTNLSVTLWIFGEPELYGMVLNSAVDNWLSQVDKPLAEQAPLFGVRHAFFQRPNAGRVVGGKYIMTIDEIEFAMKKSKLAELILPSSIDRWMESVLREQTKHRALLLTLAAQAFQRSNGQFPAAAEELVPEYLDAVPMDPFDASGAARIEYRRNEDGFTVWDLGPNRHNDGGVIHDTAGGDVGFQVSKPEKE